MWNGVKIGDSVKKLWPLLAVIVIGLTGCSSKETQRLQAENDSLKRQVGVLSKKLSDLGYSSNVSDIKQLMRNQTPSFAMLIADPEEYLEKTLTLYGYAELSGYYGCGYREARDTHYSVKLFNGRFVYIYFPKASNRELFELLGKAGSGGIPMKIEALELRKRYDLDEICRSQFFAEGVSWEVLK